MVVTWELGNAHVSDVLQGDIWVD